MSIPGAWVFTPAQHADGRGNFCEWFRADVIRESIGRPFELAQANCAHSRRGVLRGIHGVAGPPGQSKFVTCATGSVLDVVVDVRMDSPTFGRWESIRLDDVDRQAVYLSAGLGHALMSLSETTVMYLCDAPWVREHEFEVLALDPELAIAWPTELTPILSEKDAAAPTLAEAARRGLLPRYADFPPANGHAAGSRSQPRGGSR